MRNVIRIGILFSIATIGALLVTTAVSDYFMAAVFNVSGIMFSLGLGLIVTFNTQGIKNKSYVQDIRKILRKLRCTFIIYFALTVGCYIMDEFLKNLDATIVSISLLGRNISVNLSVFLCTLMLYSIVYFIYNFLEIQKLNNEIFDELNK